MEMRKTPCRFSVFRFDNKINKTVNTMIAISLINRITENIRVVWELRSITGRREVSWQSTGLCALH